MRPFWSSTDCFCNGLARTILTQGTRMHSPRPPVTVMAPGGFPANVTSLLLDMYSDYRTVREGKVG